MQKILGIMHAVWYIYILAQNLYENCVDKCLNLSVISGWIVSCCWVTFPCRWNAHWCTGLCNVRLLYYYPLLISHLPRQRETLYMWLWILYENYPFKRSERGVEREWKRDITNTDKRGEKIWKKDTEINGGESKYLCGFSSELLWHATVNAPWIVSQSF